MSDKLARLRREVFGPSADAEDELAALWRQVFGQPPPVIGAPRLLTKVLVQSLPPAPPYELGKRSFAERSPVEGAPAKPGRRPTGQPPEPFDPPCCEREDQPPFHVIDNPGTGGAS